MRYCKICGKVIEEQSIVCSSCGAKVSDKDSAAVPPITEQAPISKRNGFWKKTLIAACAVTVGVVVVVAFLIFTPSKIKSLSLSETELNLTVGDMVAIDYVIEPVNVKGVELIWSSSDESVATVDENGIVSAIKSGNCIITLTANDTSASLKVVNKDVERFPGITNETYNYAVNLIKTYSDASYLYELCCELEDAIDKNINGNIDEASMEEISNAVSACPMVLAAIADLDNISDGESDNANLLEGSCKSYWAFRYERALGEAMGEGSNGTYLYKLACVMNDMSDLAEDISGFTKFMYRTIITMTDIEDLGNMPEFIELTSCGFWN